MSTYIFFFKINLNIEQLKKNTKTICKLKIIFHLLFLLNGSFTHSLIYEEKVQGHIQYKRIYLFKS